MGAGTGPVRAGTRPGGVGSGPGGAGTLPGGAGTGPGGAETGPGGAVGLCLELETRLVAVGMRIYIAIYGKTPHCIVYAHPIPVGSKRTYTSISKKVPCTSNIEKRSLTNI